MGNNLRLPFGDPVEPAPRAPLRDEAARRAAVDPARNVVLEASAGTGKTRVLVDRYVNLLRAGVQPLNILAMTFTRKAAAEMRERIVATLREGARLSPAEAARWHDLRDRAGDIANLPVYADTGAVAVSGTDVDGNLMSLRAGYGTGAGGRRILTDTPSGTEVTNRVVKCLDKCRAFVRIPLAVTFPSSISSRWPALDGIRPCSIASPGRRTAGRRRAAVLTAISSRVI